MLANYPMNISCQTFTNLVEPAVGGEDLVSLILEKEEKMIKHKLECGCRHTLPIQLNSLQRESMLGR